MITPYILLVGGATSASILIFAAKIETTVGKLVAAVAFLSVSFVFPLWAFSALSRLEHDKLHEVAALHGYELSYYHCSDAAGTRVRNRDLWPPYYAYFTPYRVIVTGNRQRLLVRYHHFWLGELDGFQLVRLL